MPTYDYLGPCGHKFERFESMSDDKPKTCPKCGVGDAKRLLGKGNFILKGKGFYNTDYRGGGTELPPASSK